MATFTTVTKQRISWPNQYSPTDNPIEYTLLIGGSSSLLIGDAYKLIIREVGNRTNTAWQGVNKTR